MLCCGLLALVTTALIGLWRRLRALPARLLLAGLAALVSVPALAYELAGDGHLSRADLIARSMRGLCAQ